MINFQMCFQMFLQVGKQRLIPAKIDENRDFNSARKKKEKERITAMIDKLQDEQRKQQDHVNNVMARLKEEKDTWFFSRCMQREWKIQLVQNVFPFKMHNY